VLRQRQDALGVSRNLAEPEPDLEPDLEPEQAYYSEKNYIAENNCTLQADGVTIPKVNFKVKTEIIFHLGGVKAHKDAAFDWE